MKKQIEIEFERGGKFTATLLDSKAPKTCEILWKHLPMEALQKQARFSGEEFFCDTNLEIKAENQKTDWSAGDIAFYPGDKALVIYYGNKISRCHYGPKGVFLPTYNHVGCIREKLDELHMVGERVWLKGAEKVYLRKKV